MSRRATIALAAALSLALIVATLILVRQRPRRHRVFQGAPSEERAPVRGIPPVAQWTDAFSALAARGEWDELDELLDAIETRHADLYARWSLGYLHARALIEDGEEDEAARRLAPFLGQGNAFRDLALYHQAEIEQQRGNHEAASRWRVEVSSASGVHREEAIEEEIDYLSSLPDPARLIAFAAKLHPKADTSLRRTLEARTAESLFRSGNARAAFEKGVAVLRGGTTDDAADRAARLLDRREFLALMDRQQKALLGEALQSHRHFDRAAAVLRLALAGVHDDELLFAVGRSHFGAERYGEAMQTYVRGANVTRDARMKATFLHHASRAAQLRGDDATAERFMTAVIAVRGTFPATTAALTQRIRTRAKQKRFAEAESDLHLLRKIAPNDRAVFDGALAYAIFRSGGARLAALDSIPPKVLDAYDRAEIAYWRGRALESANPKAAFREYLNVMRAPVPSHFAYFARDRVTAPENAARLDAERALRDREIARLMAANRIDAAKDVATDRVLLSHHDRPAALRALAAIYRRMPAYREVLELKPAEFPRFPLASDDRADLLIAQGLFDEAADEIMNRHPLRPARSALTRAVALQRAGASRESIHAVEVLMRAVPDDFVPGLLPPAVRRLLYPRYFYGIVAEDARRHGIDPALVLSIMREESRFDPRAKSEAAARGLLQFIITTARDIGREIGLVDVEPEDLYDPRIVIHLGAKYIATLSERFDGNVYKAVAAYNAGPRQVELWERLAPAAGNDAFLSAINFDETKHYVRKVMNSHRRYREIYGASGAEGGLRPEP